MPPFPSGCPGPSHFFQFVPSVIPVLSCASAIIVGNSELTGEPKIPARHVGPFLDSFPLVARQRTTICSAEMKAIGGGMLGAIMIVAAFLAGARWNELTKNPPAPFVRYEMHVGADGTITRMDRVTGTLHMVTASGASDVPEHFVAPAVTPAKP